MSKEQIIDEAYENYSKEYEKDNSIGLTLLVQRLDGKSVYRKPDKQMFVAMCTYDKTFSEKCGLKIEERELSFKERRDLSYEYAIKNNSIPLCIDSYGEKGIPRYMETINNTGWNIPTKLITITYNNKTIESYE